MARNHYSSRKQNSFLSETREIIILVVIIFLVRSFGFGLYQVPTGSMETTMLVGERFFADKFTPLFSNFKHGDIIAMNEPTFKYSTNPVMKLWQRYVWGPSNWTKRVIGIPGDKIKGTIEDGKAVIYRNGEKLEEPYRNKYPLIGLWTVNPLKVHEKVRHELAAAASWGNQELLQQIASQSFDRFCNMRSYDSSLPYDKQPFYQMSELSIFKGFGQGTDSKPILVFPNDTIAAQPQRLIKRGNSYWSGSDEFYVELEEDEYWLMGDNRRNSHDSRFFGPVKRESIHGKVIFRILSVMPSEFESYNGSDSSFLLQAWTWISTSLPGEILLHPISFWQRVRWGRCLQWVN